MRHQFTKNPLFSPFQSKYLIPIVFSVWASNCFTVAAASPVRQMSALTPPVSSTTSATVPEDTVTSSTTAFRSATPLAPVPRDPLGEPMTPLVIQVTTATPVQADPPLDTKGQPQDIIVTARNRTEFIDPLRAVNAKSFDATLAVDKAIIGPLGRAYGRAAPPPFRSGVHNFLYNLREPVVFVNFLLQHKIGKATETAGRFAINTTVGVAGVLDMAKRKPFKLPRRSNGFADTLGFYGVPTGPFLFLPIVGPTTPRDLLGGVVDRLILPFTYGKWITKPEVVVPLAAFGVLDHRSEFDSTLSALHDNVADPYANTRTFYLERRQKEIDHLQGRGPGSSSPMSEPPTSPLDKHGHEIRPDTSVTF